MSKSFTLVEVLLYLALVAVILVVSVTFIWTIIYGNEKANRLELLRETSHFLLGKMAEDIKKATGFLTPSQGQANECQEGEEDNCLKLNQGTETIKFFLAGDSKIYRQKNNETEVLLMSEDENFEVTSFTIKNLSPSTGPGNLQILLTIRDRRTGLTYANQTSISGRDNR